jgi:hypothetical protein
VDELVRARVRLIALVLVALAPGVALAYPRDGRKLREVLDAAPS